MKARKERRYAASIELLYRAEIFFAALSFALAAVYAIGSWQSFMDSTLSMILNLLSITSLADIILSPIVILRDVFYSLSKRQRARLSVIIPSLFFLGFSLFFLFASHALIAFSEGF